jgi:hypothetical protein
MSNIDDNIVVIRRQTGKAYNSEYAINQRHLLRLFQQIISAEGRL